ncbi:abortive infection family protein [Lysobacter sp. TAF61]|uniref:abortive infection family protein n=1 Tax=Lysobacter sp. TAF61 TaxID=3233072 RepID=UPI003F962D34
MTNKRELISRVTRRHFREWLVGWTLREIDELFTSHGFDKSFIPPDMLPGGQRRNSVEYFYESVDWADEGQVARIFRVFEDILFKMTDLTSPYRAELLRYLERDGYVLDNHHLVSRSASLSTTFGVALNSQHLRDHVQRIERAIDKDPAQAIGSAKELLESVLKTILEGLKIDYSANDDVPTLLKAVQGALELAPSGVDSAKRGAAVIKRTLSNLGSIAIGLAELRNLYGTGHGKGSRHRGLSARHARLAVSASAALCTFLMETFEGRVASDAKVEDSPSMP